MRARPLQVYLDSSDFSNLSNPNKRDPNLQQIDNALICYQKSGLIEVRFSYAHIMEAAPTEADYLNSAAKRLSYIKKICGPKCMVSPIDLIRMELINITSTSTSGKIDAYKNDSHWFPDLPDKLFEIDTPESLILEEIQSMNLGRQASRKAKKQYLRSSGGLTEKARKLLDAASDGFVNEVTEKYPINDYAANVLYKYITGKGNRESALRAFTSSIADLDSFGLWYEKQWDQVNPLFCFLREIGSGLTSKMINASQTLADINDNLADSGYSKDKINSENKKNFELILSKSYRNMCINLSQKFNDDLNGQDFFTINHDRTGIYCVSQVMMRILWSICFSSRKPLESDLGDLMHILYLPYVDIFRADTFTASKIKDSKLNFDVTVVDKLAGLIDSIESKLS